MDNSSDFCIFRRVKLRKVTAASTIPVASVSRLGSTAESLRNVEEVGREGFEMGRMGRGGQSMSFFAFFYGQINT